MINLTCLAPDIVAAILDDTLPDHVTRFDLAVDPARLWEEQRRLLETSSDSFRLTVVVHDSPLSGT